MSTEYMKTMPLTQLLDALRERAQKGELAMTPEGWAELEEIAGKREVGFPGKRMRSRSAVAHD